MSTHPMLVALVRQRVAALLIITQIALTLAIVANSLSIIHSTILRMDRPTGINEKSLLLVSTSHVGEEIDSIQGKAVLDAAIRGDLTALRKLPEVADAYESNTLSLNSSTWMLGLRITPDERVRVRSAIFYADEHTLATLGAQLAFGRNFRADEVESQGLFDTLQPPVIIVSKAVADRLFPNGDALGKQVYFVNAKRASTIVGVVAQLQSSSAQGEGDNFAWNTILVPLRLLDQSRIYVVRTHSSDMSQALKSVPAALYAQDPLRVISDSADEGAGVRTFADVRASAYRSDRALAFLLVLISSILLVVTGAGIAGLSSFWVGQRRRQIGVRRALGASRADITNYFLIENLLISGTGAIFGGLLGLLLNRTLMTRFEVSPMPVAYIAIGVLVVMFLGLGAAVAPALHASRIPPADAAR